MSPFFYLASPYSKYPAGADVAFLEVCRAAAHLLRSGVPIFCPIAHTHPIEQHGGVQLPNTHEFWVEQVDRPLMEAAAGLIVVKMPTWDTSRGVQAEIEYFRNAGKPVFYMEMPR